MRKYMALQFQERLKLTMENALKLSKEMTERHVKHVTTCHTAGRSMLHVAKVMYWEPRCTLGLFLRTLF